MSAATVRAAIATYLDRGNITGVSEVFKAPPWWISGDKFKVWAQNGWGAIIAVNLDTVSEARITLPAPSVSHPNAPVGNKRREYKVGLLVILQYLIPTTQPNWENEASWVDSADQVLDGITALLEADPNLGNPAVIFQAAQEPGDISIARDVPKLDSTGGIMHVWSVVEFTAVEIVTA